MRYSVTMEEIFSQPKNAASEVSEDEKINYVLLSMPESCDITVTGLATVENVKIDFLKDRLLNEEE